MGFCGCCSNPTQLARPWIDSQKAHRERFASRPNSLPYSVWAGDIRARPGLKQHPRIELRNGATGSHSLQYIPQRQRRSWRIRPGNSERVGSLNSYASKYPIAANGYPFSRRDGLQTPASYRGAKFAALAVEVRNDSALRYSSPWPWVLALTLGVSTWAGIGWLVWTLV
jgi:hypothetical protein